MSNGRPSERGILEVADDLGNVITDVNRLRLGPGMTMTRNDNDPSIVIDSIGGSTGTSAIVALDTIADLRALPALALIIVKTAQTRGYLSEGDGGGWSYDWYPSNVDADDGALTIKVTAVTTGRFKFRMPAERIFPLSACSIDGTGVTRVGAALSSLSSTLITAGYIGMDGCGRSFNCTGVDYTIPARAEWVPWKHYRMHLMGEAHASGSDGKQRASATVESGFSGSGAVSPLSLPIYGPRYWTETLYAGMDTFTGVADIRNLSVGDTILCKYGSDPSDASGGPMFWQYCKIKAITPTTGTAGNIQIEETVVETPFYPLPAYNINMLRDGNKHDFYKVTGFQDNLYWEDCKLTTCYLNAEFGRNFTSVNVKGFSQNFAYLFFACFATKIDNTYCNSLTGINVTGGDPSVDPYANYGAFCVINYCRGTTFHDLTVKEFCASGGMLDSEVNCRGTYFTGLTTVGIRMLPDPAPTPITGGFGATPHNFDIVSIDCLRLENGGQMNNGNMLRIGTLVLGKTFALWGSLYPGQVPQPAGGSIMAGHVQDVLICNENEYSIKKSCLVTCIGIAINGTTTFEIPQKGILRSIKVKPSSLTGITSFTIGTNDLPGYEEVINLTAGAWANIESPTVLTNVIANLRRDNQRIKIVTDGTFNANTWISVEIEVFTVRRKYDGTDTYSDITVPPMIAFSGAPNVSATFVGQTAICNGATSIYAAVTAGNGAADWVRISGAGDALTSNPLSQFAATTSAQLRGVLSDETGTGVAVFATSPTLVTPVLGAATATSVNKVALTAPASGSTLTVADGKTLTASDDATIGGIFKIAGGNFSSVSSLSASWSALQYNRLELTLNLGVTNCDPAITLTGLAAATYGSTGAYLSAFSGTGLWSQSNFAAQNSWKLPDFVDGGCVRLVIFPIRTGGAAIRCVTTGASGQANGTFVVFTGTNTDAVNQATGLAIAFGATSSGFWELWGFK